MFAPPPQREDENQEGCESHSDHTHCDDDAYWDEVVTQVGGRGEGGAGGVGT